MWHNGLGLICGVPLFMMMCHILDWLLLFFDSSTILSSHRFRHVGPLQNRCLLRNLVGPKFDPKRLLRGRDARPYGAGIFLKGSVRTPLLLLVLPLVIRPPHSLAFFSLVLLYVLRSLISYVLLQRFLILFHPLYVQNAFLSFLRASYDLFYLLRAPLLFGRVACSKVVSQSLVCFLVMML